MKKYELVLNNNEELMVDVDDLMAEELITFKNTIKGMKDFTKFKNWTKAYRALNYDIIEGLEVKQVYKCNETAAVVKLSFRDIEEYDLVHFNPETMTVACMNVKGDKVRPYVVRRLLVPQNVDDALKYAKSTLPEEGIKTVKTTLEQIKKNDCKPEVKQETKKEQPKPEVKQETKKEQPKPEVKQETKKEQPMPVVKQQVKKYPQPNYKAAVSRVERFREEPKPARPKCGFQADGHYKFY